MQLVIDKLINQSIVSLSARIIMILYHIYDGHKKEEKQYEYQINRFNLSVSVMEDVVEKF